MVCYYSGWAVYRRDPFTFTPAEADPALCTHLIYAFAGLDADTMEIVALDREMDIVSGYYKAAVGLKSQNPDLKVMIAIGGWNEGGKKYSDMASKKEYRDKSVVIVFLIKFFFVQKLK